jgi:hypothetical protein
VLLDSTGDLPEFCRLSTGPEVTKQKIEIRLRTVLGEWFLDAQAGLPYQTWQLSKPFLPQVVSATIRAEVLKVSGVISVTSWDYSWDVATRSFSCTGEVKIQGLAQTVPLVASIFPDGGNANSRIAFYR